MTLYGEELEWHWQHLNPEIGDSIKINLGEPMRKGDYFNLTVEYETLEEGLSLNWLDPPQTSGKKHPYVYTHCEAIDCRCLAPLQDTPSVKATYSALITLPKELTAKMSANETAAPVIVGG